MTSHFSLPSIEFVAAIAKEAGELSLKYFRPKQITQLQITEKPENAGLVTIADVACETLIISRIQQNFPNQAILGEEGGLLTKLATTDQESGTLGARPINKSYGVGDFCEGEIFWCVDPIDGTTNFSNGNSFYCVSIALAKKENGLIVPILGAIYHPYSHDLYTAERSKGSFCNGQRIHVSNKQISAQASFSTGFSSNRNETLRQVTNLIYEIQNQSMGLRINGAAALDLALTACGINDGFFESRLQPWDMAAGALIASEAGAKVTNYQGKDFCLLRDSNIIAANENFHDFLLPTIEKFFG